MMALNAEHLPRACPETPRSFGIGGVAKYHKVKAGRPTRLTRTIRKSVNLLDRTPIMRPRKMPLWACHLRFYRIGVQSRRPRYVVGYWWKLPQISTNTAPFNPARLPRRWEARLIVLKFAAPATTGGT
jgi:hypothetical protein